jgi:uncharacterized membrane protein
MRRARQIAATVAVPALAACAAASYAVYSIVRHRRFESQTFDMAIMDHIVWRWSRLRLPDNPVQGFPHELGDHFSPVFALLGPTQWLHPGPTGALIAQGLLIGLSIIPVHRFARRRLGAVESFALALSYALFWGVWAAVDFDFHETAFAAPLLAFAIDFADAARWRPCFACLAGLVLVKEDMPLLIVAFGVWLLVTGRRRQGVFASGAGLAAFVIVNAVVMPALSGGAASHTDQRLYGALGSSPLRIAWRVVSDPSKTFDLMTHPSDKLRLIAVMFGAFLFLGLLSPLSIVVVPQFVERLLTVDPHYWAPLYHYTLTIAPALAMGAADGLSRLQSRLRPSPISRSAAFGLTLGVLLLAVGSAATGPPARLVDPSFYHRTEVDRAGDAAVKLIPRADRVAADDRLLPHLSSRNRAYPLGRDAVARADWIALRAAPGRTPAMPGWRVVFRRAGVFVLRRERRAAQKPTPVGGP